MARIAVKRRVFQIRIHGSDLRDHTWRRVDYHAFSIGCGVKQERYLRVNRFPFFFIRLKGPFSSVIIVRTSGEEQDNKDGIPLCLLGVLFNQFFYLFTSKQNFRLLIGSLPVNFFWLFFFRGNNQKKNTGKIGWF